MQALIDRLAQNPSKQRRRQLTVVGLAAMTGVLGFAISGFVATSIEDCASAANEVHSIWSNTRQAQVQRGFSSSGHPLAEDTVARVAPRLDAYADQWSDMRVAACELHLKGQQSDRLFDLRTTCLDRRLAHFEALVAEFETPEPAIVAGAVWAAASLPPITACSDVDALTSAVPPPKDPQVRREVKLLRESLAGVTALVDLGSYEDALHRARRVLTRSEQLGYAPLTAEALLHLGTAQLEAFQPEPAYASLSRSAVVATQSGEELVAAEALARRMWVAADPLGKPTVGLADADIAGALIARHPSQTHLRWLYRNNYGVALFRNGDAPAAEQAYREAIVVLGDAQAKHPVGTISTGYNLASLLSASARPGAAANELEHVLQQAISLLGERHPRVAGITVELVLQLIDVGQSTKALALLDKHFSSLGPQHTYLQASYHTAYAYLWLYLRAYQKAGEHAEYAVTKIEAQYPEHPLRLQAQALLALSQIAQGEPDHGLESLRELVAHTQARLGKTHETTGHAYWWYGTGLMHTGNLERAIDPLARATNIYRELGPVAPAVLARHGSRLAEVSLKLGQVDRASTVLGQLLQAQNTIGLPETNPHRLKLKMLRGALDLARERPVQAEDVLSQACRQMSSSRDRMDPELAACRLAWSRAVRSRATSRALAAQAHAAFIALGPGFDAEQREAQELLAADN